MQKRKHGNLKSLFFFLDNESRLRVVYKEVPWKNCKENNCDIVSLNWYADICDIAVCNETKVWTCLFLILLIKSPKSCVYYLEMCGMRLNMVIVRKNP